jgi:putative transcriptional regulator
MNPDDPAQLCLRGSLLLADPSLQDPNFHRTVLLLTEHRHDHGAHGYILNRPMSQSTGELLSAPEFKALARIPVFLGGPVSTEQLTFASLAWQESTTALTWHTHLTREDAEERLNRGENVRAFVGYSGWAEGQLENEIKHRSWITCKPSPEAVRGEHPEALWGDLLKGMGPWFHLLSKIPEDPGLN